MKIWIVTRMAIGDCTLDKPFKAEAHSTERRAAFRTRFLNLSKWEFFTYEEVTLNKKGKS
jgi:hypothetical protein